MTPEILVGKVCFYRNIFDSYRKKAVIAGVRKLYSVQSGEKTFLTMDNGDSAWLDSVDFESPLMPETKLTCREWTCVSCGTVNALGSDKRGISSGFAKSLLCGERQVLFCRKCHECNQIMLTGHLVNLNESSESSSAGGCSAVAAQ